MCTTLLITAKDGAVVSGRTMEFGFDLESEVMVIPAGTPMTGTLPNDAKGINYSTKYGMLGANALDFPVIVDGINEKGLFFSALYFPGYAEFADVTPVNALHAMAPHELGNWVLGTCADVEEVRDRIGDIVLVKTTVEALGGPAPLHYIVRDASGKSLVIEPLGGELQVYDNLVGVMTNSPTFDWHLTNLSNYSGLTALNVGSVVLGGNFPLPQFGQGSGMIGLPGDSTPPSRFVRAVAYSQTALPTDSGADAVLQVFHIMNCFDIPVGSVREMGDQQLHTDYTIWTSVADLKSNRWYFRTYNDQSIRMVDLHKALEAAGSKVRFISMNSVQPIVDTSTDFKPANPK